MTKLKTIKEIDLRNEVIFKISKYLEDGTDMETINELLNIEYQKGYQTAKQEFTDKIDKCSGIKCGWMDGEICERIDKEELKKSLNQTENTSEVSDNEQIPSKSDGSPIKSLGADNAR